MKRQEKYRIKIETRHNGEVWYTPQFKYKLTLLFGMIPIFSYGWYNIHKCPTGSHKCPTGSYEYSDSLEISHRNEEDAMVAIKGLKDTLAKETGRKIEKIDYKYF
jgi:hypothetical protein